eukprot:gene2266-4409_t
MDLKCLSGLSSGSPFLKLPEQLVEYLMHFLDVEDLARSAVACRVLSQESEKAAKYILNQTVLSSFIYKMDNFYSQKKCLYMMTRRRFVVIDGTECPFKSAERPQTFISQSNTSTGRIQNCHILHYPHVDDFNVEWSCGGLIAFSGQNRNVPAKVEVYNSLHEEWRQMKSLPLNLRRIAVSIYKNVLYVTGGYLHDQHCYSDNVFILKLTSSTSAYTTEWQRLPDNSNLLNRRCEHASVVYRGKLWVGGGRVEGSSFITATTETLDFRTGHWSVGPNMLSRRSKFKLMVICEDLYAVGGNRKENNVLAPVTIERFDDQTNTWCHVAQLPDGRGGQLTYSNQGEKIFVLSGSHHSKSSSLSHLVERWDCFDLQSGEWENYCYQDNTAASSASNSNSRANQPIYMPQYTKTHIHAAPCPTQCISW